MQAARIGTWRLLGRLFARAPDAELLATLAELEPADPETGPVPMGWELLRRAAIRARTGASGALEDEYFALFVGVGRGELVPYGSWYLTGFLMEKPVALLRADLARLGLEREAGTVESEDHAAALAESLSHVIAASDEIDLATQRAFFRGPRRALDGTLLRRRAERVERGLLPRGGLSRKGRRRFRARALRDARLNPRYLPRASRERTRSQSAERPGAMHMKKSDDDTKFIDARRRGFLAGGAAAGAAAVTGVGQAAPPPDADLASRTPETRTADAGYRLTDHVRTYYDKAR